MVRICCRRCIKYPNLPIRTTGEKRPICPNIGEFEAETRTGKSPICGDFEHYVTCGLCAAYKTTFCSWSDPALNFKSDLACGDYYPDRHIRQMLHKRKVTVVHGPFKRRAR